MKLSKTYNPKDYEKDIYALWEKSGAFAPSGTGEPFSIVMPPPNANAGLHMGHMLVFGIQDTLIRYNRMIGKDTVWIPGADHAGFETQVVYEKHLAAEGKSRFDFTREELYDQIYEFVAKNRENFYDMFRQMGASCDWSRFTFTLDDKVVDRAYKTFKKMLDDGLIYRGNRPVNYCTEHRTGFADIEVNYEEQTTPLYYLKYGPFTLATTRPETKFGDTAVAVHPDDKRYKHLINTVIEVEGLNGPFELRVIADDYVDPEFGTGAVKMTPAHDFNDWEVGQRHNLQAVRVINHDGTMNHRAGTYEGLTVLEARKKVVKDLKAKGLLEKIDEHYTNRVGTCYKCGTVIEPMLMEQWFVDMKKLSAPAIKALKDKKIRFYPDAKREQTITYMENLRDWNISRQNAWGIPVPAFQNVNDPDDWIFDKRVKEEIIEVDGQKYRRDSDVFDTWFSSGQWPFITTNFELNDDFKKYYPTTLMETGVDILYQWVSRMISLGLYVTGDIPFKDVYLHGMVRSEDGRKMSKSLGNVVDPVPLLDEFGADAVRVGIMAGRSPGDSGAYAPDKLRAGRNFCNKLWNIARFIEGTFDEKSPESRVQSLEKNEERRMKNDGAAATARDSRLETRDSPKSSVDHWMLSKLQHEVTVIAELLDDYRMAEAYERLYHFVWDDVADWYIEASKSAHNAGLLRFVLESVLKLAHPFVPFVSETIWQTLEWTGDSLLISQDWPTAKKFDRTRAKEFEDIRSIVTEVRAISTAMQLKQPSLYFTGVPFLSENAELIVRLAGLKAVSEVADGNGLHLTETQYNCWLDVDRGRAQKYVQKLEQNQKVAESRLAGLKKRLDNKKYVDNAPKKLVDETKGQVKETEVLIENIKQEINRYSSS